MKIFRTSTANLLGTQEKAGVGHHVALSVVDTERPPDRPGARAQLSATRFAEWLPLNPPPVR